LKELGVVYDYPGYQGRVNDVSQSLNAKETKTKSTKAPAAETNTR